MKTINLTQGKVALIDDDMFAYLNQWKWMAQYDNHTRSYYATRAARDSESAKQKRVRMHRLILGLLDNDKLQVDHKNHNTLDNTKINLRVATVADNCANRKSKKGTSSNYKGVGWYKPYNKWLARIAKGEYCKNLGYFIDEKDAAMAYNKAAIEIHGEFACLNKLTG